MKKMMMYILFSLYSMMASAEVDRRGVLNAIKACLYQHSWGKNIVYSSIDTGEIITDDSYSEFGGASYVEYKGLTIGYGKYRDKMAFYSNKIAHPLSDAVFINIGYHLKAIPKEINYLVSEWGGINLKNKSYICVNAPFDGIGESGEYQRMRNVFIFNVKNRGIYYSVGRIDNKG